MVSKPRMPDQSTPRLMTKTEYARYRGVSQPYVSKLARNSVLVMRGDKIDVVATDKVLDDKPVEELEEPQPIRTAPRAGGDAWRIERANPNGVASFRYFDQSAETPLG